MKITPAFLSALALIVLMAFPPLAQDAGPSPSSICQEIIRGGEEPADKPFLNVSLSPPPLHQARQLIIIGYNFQPGQVVNLDVTFT